MPLNQVTDVRIPSFTNQSLLVTSPGQYWCQVLDYTDGGEGHLLGRSNVLEVLPQKSYSSLPVCTGTQSVMESKCADLSPSSLPPVSDKSSVLDVLTTVRQASTIPGQQLCMLVYVIQLKMMISFFQLATDHWKHL